MASPERTDLLDKLWETRQELLHVLAGGAGTAAPASLPTKQGAGGESE